MKPATAGCVCRWKRFWFCCHILALWFYEKWGKMQFKQSAGIFVGGLAASFGGTLLVLMATAANGDGAALVGLVGILVSVSGIVMLCVGAARALAIIDAIPAAFRNLDGYRAPHQQGPAAAPQGFHQSYPQQQVYNQPPVQ